MCSGLTVCHISFNHQPFDDRIYWKEALSLKQAGYNVVHIATAENDDDFYTKEGIRLILVKRVKLAKNVYINRVLQTLFKRKGTINKIFKIAANLNASVFHYHDLQINAIARDLRCLPQKPKVIYDTHEAYHLLLKQEEAFGIIKFLLNKLFAYLITKWELNQAVNCHYIIATDRYTLNYFEKKLPQIPKSIIYNYSFFLPHNYNPHAIKEYDFIYSGMLSRKRGIKEIILAIKECKSVFPHVSLLLIGYFDKEDLLNEVKHIIGLYDLDKNITIIENVPFSEMEHFYKASKIGLCLWHNTPKYTTSIPIKLFEYMAFGLPLIFSDHGLPAKIITDTSSGILVDHRDIHLISNAMKRLLTNKELYQMLSENGKLAVEQKFNWKKEQENLLKIYDRLLNKNNDKKETYN